MRWWFGIRAVKACKLMMRKFAEERADVVEAGFVVWKFVIRHTGNLTMCRSAAKCFNIHFFADGCLHQVRACKKNGSRLVDDDCLVRHDGQIRASSHTASHDSSN